MSKSRRSAFIYDHVLSQHVLSPEHPLKPRRLRYTYELVDSYGGFDVPQVELVRPRLATDDELLGFHKREYIDAVRAMSLGVVSIDPASFGFDKGDNPVHEGMYEASLLSSGASMLAAELLISGEWDSVMSISGGLHHAMPRHASGFCIFNDPVMAINRIVSEGIKVAYVDIDCHHGDGVQLAYYDTDSVLTISVHESGEFLFPGTGFTSEEGCGKGRGYSVNLPLYPYTNDETYLWAFRQVVPPLLESFGPDLIVTQLGMDSHFMDPLTHMSLTVQGFRKIVTEFDLVPAKWLALGGGGYDLQAVARGWTSAYGVMSGQDFANDIPSTYSEIYDVSTLSDEKEVSLNEEYQSTARSFAENSISDIRNYIFPLHGLRP